MEESKSKEIDDFQEKYDNFFKDRYDGKYDPRCKGCGSICCTFCSVENPEIEKYYEIIKEIKKKDKDEHRRESMQINRGRHKRKF